MVCDEAISSNADATFLYTFEPVGDVSSWQDAGPDTVEAGPEPGSDSEYAVADDDEKKN